MDRIMVLAKKIRKKLKDVNLERLLNFLYHEGWKVIFFDPKIGHEILNALNLTEYSRTVKSFAFYQGGRYPLKIVFINQNEPYDMQTYWLAHELGHILLNHVYSFGFHGHCARYEAEADLFAACLLNSNLTKETNVKVFNVLAYAVITLILCLTLSMTLRIYIDLSGIRAADAYAENTNISSISAGANISHESGNRNTYTCGNYAKENGVHTVQAYNSDKSIPKLSINSSALDDLKCVPHLNYVMASRIIDYREQNGAFDSIDDLISVPGFTLEYIDKLRPYLTV